MTAEKILEYVDAKVESGRRIDIESLAAYEYNGMEDNMVYVSGLLVSEIM